MPKEKSLHLTPKQLGLSDNPMIKGGALDSDAGETAASRDPDDIARECLRLVRVCATDEQYQESLKRVRAAIQHAFDLGFKAAGGQVY